MGVVSTASNKSTHHRTELLFMKLNSNKDFLLFTVAFGGPFSLTTPLGIKCEVKLTLVKSILLSRILFVNIKFVKKTDPCRFN